MINTSKLIEILQDKLQTEGDLPVVVESEYDGSTGWDKLSGEVDSNIVRIEYSSKTTDEDIKCLVLQTYY